MAGMDEMFARLAKPNHHTMRNLRRLLGKAKAALDRYFRQQDVI
jgi:hypothetical protein